MKPGVKGTLAEQQHQRKPSRGARCLRDEALRCEQGEVRAAHPKGQEGGGTPQQLQGVTEAHLHRPSLLGREGS